MKTTIIFYHYQYKKNNKLNINKHSNILNLKVLQKKKKNLNNATNEFDTKYLNDYILLIYVFYFYIYCREISKVLTN